MRFIEQSLGALTTPHNIDNLPEVSDPEKTDASITRDEYQSFVDNYGDFEKETAARTSDTSLIDEAPADAIAANKRAKAQQKRNIERYGTELTGAQNIEMDRSYQRSTQLGVAGNTNNARIAQIESNTELRNKMLNIGNDVYGQAMTGLGNASSGAASRRQAFNRDKAQTKAQNIGAIGQLGATLGSAWMLGLI